MIDGTGHGTGAGCGECVRDGFPYLNLTQLLFFLTDQFLIFFYSMNSNHHLWRDLYEIFPTIISTEEKFHVTSEFRTHDLGHDSPYS